MKQVLVMVILLFLSIVGQAQNNQMKLYLQQIAANKVYIEYLQKGYRIAKNGLSTIGHIKNGHFSLDKDFFEGLKTINPNVMAYAKVVDIMTLNSQILRRYKKAVKVARESNRFASGELDYAGSVFNRLIDNCAALVEELTVLITPSELGMTDDQRISRIDGLYQQMQDNYVFVNSFSGDIEVMSVQRSRELTDASMLRFLYGQ